MSDLQIIKQRLLDEDKLQDVFEAMGCTYVTFNANRIEAQLPERFDSKNKRSVQTKLNDSLTSYIRSRADFDSGDIYSLVSYLVNDKRGNDIQKDLHEAKRFIVELFGWTEYLEGGDFKTKKDYVAPLKALLGDRRRKREVIPNAVLPDNVMEQYYIKGRPLPYYGWLEEGIDYNTQVLYNVGFCLETHRVVFPIKNRFGQNIGVKGRALDEADTKYLYLYKCNISQEWFNFHFALPYILKEKKVIIVESEKSCMKFASNGIWNTLAICSSDITQIQADMIKQLGLDVEVILAYDKDKSASDVHNYARVFEGREVYGVIDMNGLLGEKDSPIDCGIDIWNQLIKNNCYDISY